MSEPFDQPLRDDEGYALNMRGERVGKPAPQPTCGEINPAHPDLICQYPAGHGKITDPVGPATEGGDPWPVTYGEFDHGDQSKGMWWTAIASLPEAQPEITHPHTPDQVLAGPALARHLGRDHGYHSSNDLENFTATHDRLHGGPNPRVREDRVICALAGVDFQRYFVPDDGIALRGALRAAYGKQASELLRAVDRGHLADLIVPTDNSAEALLARSGEEMAALRSQLAIDQREHGRSLDAVQRQLEEARRQNTELTQHKTALIQRRDEALERLGEVAGERDRAQERLMEKLTEAGQLREERDRALEAGRMLEAQRDDARRQLANVQDRADELDTASQLAIGDLEAVTEQRDQLMDSLSERTQQRDKLKVLLARRTAALDEGRSALRDVITDLQRFQTIGIQPNVSPLIEALERIQGGPVSTARPIGILCDEAHLGLATTGEMLAEITTRIDLGHCGLDYRTVDGD